MCAVLCRLTRCSAQQPIKILDELYQGNLSTQFAHTGVQTQTEPKRLLLRGGALWLEGGYLLDDMDAEALESRYTAWPVGDQSYLREAEIG